jgi:N-acetyl-gamma-glutamylphosphate reductase
MRSIAAFLLTAGALVLAAPALSATHIVSPVTVTILVGKHGVAGGPKKYTVRKNRHVVLLVKSAIGKAVHLHGYDIEKQIRIRTAFVRIAFIAKVTGVFEIELHLTETRGVRIGLLTVK